MKFAALALLAVVLFSDDAEARRGKKRGGRGGRGKNGVKAECTLVQDQAEDPTGGFYLRQSTKKDGTVRPIHVGGKFEFAAEDAAVNWSINVFDNADCTGTQVGATVDVNERACKSNTSTKLGGSIGDGTTLLNTFAGYSINIVDADGAQEACCAISNLVDPNEVTTRMLEADMLQ